ncbi:2-hydroxyacid dehydrogenase [Muriicola sp.]|uniref:2-hydroxyacid dehydrogenase n=1 Tax=Muriicola sp. TaxID=2020856 RepID=UPI003C790D72
MKVLHLDTNHPLLLEQLAALGFENTEEYTADKNKVQAIVHQFDGIILRSRFKIDREFLDKATNLKFIGRVGAGLENIDVAYAEEKGIFLAAAPEGNRNAVGEQSLGMILSLFNNLNKADKEVRRGLWDREGNRGLELDGKTIGIIGYGNMGKAFAKKLQGFEVEVLCVDLLENVGDQYATQVSLKELQQKTDVLSLHLPQTNLTIGMVNKAFIEAMGKPFWLVNTARGKCVVTRDLVDALNSGKILGAALDVLEYEKTSFEDMFGDRQMPEEFNYLLHSEKVLLTPHIAGWTRESKIKLAETIVKKISERFC